MRILSLIAVSILCLALPGAARERSVPEGTRPSAAGNVPKLETARAQLEHADQLRRGLRGLEEEARAGARKLAIEAYQAVREHFAADAPACAEAAYRAAELLRQTGDLDAARAAFGVARARGHGTPWRVRAAMENGHLERRAKRNVEALACYEAVMADDAAGVRQRDEAALAAGRCLSDLERSDDAVRVWRRVAEGGDDPLDRVRAFDLWAQELIGRKDLEGAAGVLASCRTALEPAAAEESRLGERVRAALDSMRAHDELARAVERRERDRRTTKSG